MSRVASQGRGSSGGLSERCYRLDEIAVERAVNGQPPARLTFAEIAAAVSILAARQVSTRDTARRLGVADRTVNRHLARLRTAEGT